MRTLKTFLLVALSCTISLSSCVSKKNLTYLQYSGKKADYDLKEENSRQSITPSEYKVMAYDNLFIRVITPDPQWSAIFNTTPVGAGGAVTEESASLLGYPVDVSGEIEIPFVGKIPVAGKTLTQIKTELDSIFKKYVTDASISVRLVNNYISVIGEVNTPGRYNLTKDRINIFEALSLASDLGAFSNRQKIQIIRPSPYGPVIKEFSLTDRSILSSEFYYIMPNDIIYAMPLRGRSFQTNSAVWTIFLTTITSTMGVIAFFRTL